MTVAGSAVPDDWAGRSMVVVGSGSIGRRHLTNLRRLCPASRIAVLCRPESAVETLYSAGADTIITTMDEALALAPSVAIVANPAPFHVPVAQAFADAGCHLLVEKPLADRLDGVDRLITTCKSGGLVLMVGYCLRFYPSLQKMVGLVSEGAIGRVLHIASEIGQYLPDWRPDADYREGVTARASLGGGAVFELSHEIDIALWLGGQVDEVIATLGRLGDLEIDTEDSADLMLGFASGARATIHLDLLQRVPCRRTRVIGSLGTLEWDGMADSLRLGRPGSGWRLLPTPQLKQRNDLYQSELEHFMACIDGRTEPLTDALAARQTLTVALAARESAAMGRAIRLESADRV